MKAVARTAVVRAGKRVLALRPMTAVLRLVLRHPRLPEPIRARLFFDVAKHVPLDPSQVHAQPVDGGATIRLRCAGTGRIPYWLGHYEPESMPIFLAYARTARAVLDVGAADGLYALFAAAVNPRARVLAFEPSTRQSDRLRDNLALNADVVGDRVMVFDLALGDRSGTFPLFELPGDTSSLNPGFRESAVPRLVVVARGDDIVTEHVPNASVDLIKLDTESTEPAVLRGLASTIGRHRPAVVCEVLRDRTEPELEAFFFGEADYDAYWLTPDGPQRRSRIVGDPAFRYVNYLFVPSGSALPAPL